MADDTQEKTGTRPRKNWGEASREERHEDERPLPGGEARKREADQVEEESEDSFPASDPPSFTPAKIG